MEACDDGADDVLAIDRVSTEVTLTGDSPHQYFSIQSSLSFVCFALGLQDLQNLTEMILT